MKSTILALLAAAFLGGCSGAAEPGIHFDVGQQEVVATKAQRDGLGLKWFVDGNLGVLKRDAQYVMYGANGSRPARVTGTAASPLMTIDPVTISTGHSEFRYLAGGPVFVDPETGRVLLFYHAEIHRGTAKNFYSVLGLAIQTDSAGLAFGDLGPIFSPNVPNAQAGGAVEVCGAPYVVKDGYFYVYTRDAMLDGRQSNLSVVRAKVADVLAAARSGASAPWQKFYRGSFCEPALGGKSTPLEVGNPQTRWMDVSYNSAIKKFIMVVAANTTPSKVSLFISFSDDGIAWTKRKQLTDDGGECFYPSIVGLQDDPRQTASEFYVYYTQSQKGGWDRWSDAALVRRKVSIF